ncbi:MAG: protein kinase domain-containing protein, partial [Thermoleophilaceae bacterium]
MSPPQTVAGRYRIERRLGAGGMSTVFQATDSVLERSVAVKLLAEHLAEDEAFVARFRREALSAARLQHPNIVQVFDSGQDPESGRHYIVMECVDGPSCADLLRERKRLELEETVHIVRDACHGLDYAHRAGVVHRDVKPGNLLVAEEMNIVKLADFGIAKAAEQTRITQVGSILGTAAYLSPEQARGDESGPPSDIYSLGVCAYQFLTGRLPHEYSSLTELALKQQQHPVQPITDFRPEVPAEVDEAIRLCLERDPAGRYRSALEMAQALESGLRGEATEATRRLALSDTDAGRGMDATSATRAMPRTAYAPAAATPAPAYAETAAPQARRERREA